MNFESFWIIFNIIISENEYIETNHDFDVCRYPTYIIARKSKWSGISKGK